MMQCVAMLLLIYYVFLLLFTESGVLGQRKSYDFGQNFQKLSTELSRYTDYFKSHEYGEVKNLLNTLWKKSAAKQGIQIAQADPGASFRNHVVVNDGTEYDANGAVAGDLLEGDIVCTKEQVQQLIDDIDNSRSRVKRKVIASSFYRWKSTTIPYRIGLTNSNGVSAIRKAIAHWEENTCLNFREGTGSDYIYFVQGSGCYSNIGRTGGQQEISIGRGCERMGIAAHEIGHALGFWHEQSRSDRDSYVSINSANIISGAQGNFGKRTTRDSNNFNIPYDIGSVMHYSSKSFSSNNRNTISTRDPLAQNTIGQREALSFIDVKLVNTIYCSSTCRRSLSCQHGGYVDPSPRASCSKCKCPSGFGGTTCDRADDSSGCGVDLVATSDWQTLTGNRKCNWVITGSGRIILDVQRISASCSTTCSSYLEVKSGPNFEQTGNRYCCTTPSSQIVTSGSEAVVIFKPGSSFTLRYRTDGRSGSGGGRPPSPPPPPRPPPSRVGPRPSPSSWGSWSSWSSCSATCGMCGWKSRRRQCSGSSCFGKSSENAQCGSRACPRGNQRRPVTTTTSKCERLVQLPCAWLRIFTLLSFDPQNYADVGRDHHNLLKDMPDDFSGGKVRFVDDAKGGFQLGDHLKRIFRGKRQTDRARRFGRQRSSNGSRGRYRERDNNRNDDDDWCGHSSERYNRRRTSSGSRSPSSSLSGFSRSSTSSTSNNVSGMCSKKISYNCIRRDSVASDDRQFCCGSATLSGSTCTSTSTARSRDRG